MARGRQCCCCPRWTFKRFVVTLRRKKWFLVLTLAFLNAALLVGGAAIVMYLEADNEKVLRHHHTAKMHALQRLFEKCARPVPCPWLHEEAMQLIDETNHIEKDLPVILRWDFKGALVFTATVMTTIGYGWLHPVTPGGRMFTVIFGTVSIPALFLFLSVISEYLVWICQYVNRVTFVRLGGSYVTPNGGPRQRYTVMITGCVVVAYLTGISALYQHLASSFNNSNEYPKTYEESLYFAFVTFSTIGFGDFVLRDFDDSDSMDALSATGFLLSMLFGLVVLWTLVSVLQIGLQRLVAKADYVVITTAEMDGDGDDEMIHILTSKESQLEAETEAWDEATQLLKSANPLANSLGNGPFIGSPRALRRARPAHLRLTDDMGGWKYSAPPSPSSPSPSRRSDANDAADDPAEDGAGGEKERAPGKNEATSVYE